MAQSTFHPRLTILIMVVMVLTLACDLSASTGGAATTQTVASLEATSMEQPTDTPAPITDTPAPTDTPTLTPLPTSTNTPTATFTLVHIALPGDPGALISQIDDLNNSATAAQKRATSGEDFANNRFERPFAADMAYLPDADLTHIKLSIVDKWVYATFYIAGSRAEGIGQTKYGLEIDVNQDGRGDYLIWGASPAAGAAWTTDGVQIWKDTNRDVGGATPQVSDVGGGDGYEESIFDGGRGADADLAWIRRGVDPLQVQLAFKYSLLLAAPTFYWDGFADAGMKRHEWFDLNDHFTLDDAGSPLSELKANYPLKNFFGFDNTCLNWLGPTPKEIKAWFCQQPLGAISGKVYQDKNKNSKKDSDEIYLPDIQVMLFMTSCTKAITLTDVTGKTGEYFFSKLASNSYCITLGAGSAGHLITTSNPVTIFLAPGEIKKVDFGMQ
jgi:hypothetical protein